MLLTLLLLFAALSAGDAQVRLSTHKVDILLGEQGGFNVSLSDGTGRTVPVHVYPCGDILASPENVTFWLTGNETRWINVSANRVGHAAVAVTCMRIERFVDVNVSKIRWLNIINVVFGWIYFIAWSVSFYPQMYINWKRKSVVGLNLDFVSLNVTGFAAYSAFNLGLFFSSAVQEEYLSVHKAGGIPVEVNDIVFSVHAFLAASFTAIQCIIYERRDQTVSLAVRLILGALWLTIVVFLLVTVAGLNSVNPWLTFLDFVSSIKLAITFVKYIPQAYFNFRRKSTVGWSIEGIFLDFTGGTFSMLQMFVVAYNFDDWTSFFGNVTKFGLGAVSIVFDIIFVLQHYVFFRHKPSPLLEDVQDSEDTQGSEAVA
ncbi:cystinosin homolog [Ornithodoros turicata]|uniref:cystinosin homolog n=1 Tax=Ornithodoros turicata TaxID=34597 RepID=UPI0031390EFD